MPTKKTAEATTEFTSETPKEKKIKGTLSVPGAGLGRRKEAIARVRALNEIDRDSNRPALKKAGFLSRDARVIERKKAGLKKARKASQFSKR